MAVTQTERGRSEVGEERERVAEAPATSRQTGLATWEMNTTERLDPTQLMIRLDVVYDIVLDTTFNINYRTVINYN
jgi:hypothetical protein